MVTVDNHKATRGSFLATPLAMPANKLAELKKGASAAPEDVVIDIAGAGDRVRTLLCLPSTLSLSSTMI